MSLFEYLSNYYFDQAALLQNCQIDEDTLSNWQDKGLFPKPAYRLKSQIECSSYYGLHQCTEYWDYYPRGYVKWAKLLNSKPELTSSQAFELFFTQYGQHLNALAQQGLICSNESFNDEFAEHVQSQWQHFLNGKFGLLTQNGFVEEIVETEVAISLISDITQLHSKPELNSDEKQVIRTAVKKLSKSLSHFAPHERDTSYRKRFIDDTIKLYNLKA